MDERKKEKRGKEILLFKELEILLFKEEKYDNNVKWTKERKKEKKKKKHVCCNICIYMRVYVHVYVENLYKPCIKMPENDFTKYHSHYFVLEFRYR